MCSHLFTPLNSDNLFSLTLLVSCKATFHSTADVSCGAVWENFMFLLEYELQMVRAEQEKQKGVLIDNTLNHAIMQREVHF